MSLIQLANKDKRLFVRLFIVKIHFMKNRNFSDNQNRLVIFLNFAQSSDNVNYKMTMVVNTMSLYCVKILSFRSWILFCCKTLWMGRIIRLGVYRTQNITHTRGVVYSSIAIDEKPIFTLLSIQKEIRETFCFLCP